MADVGRPDKYKPEYCEMLLEHMAKGLSFESFAGVVQVTKATIYNWLKLHEEFLYAKEKATELSRLFWEQNGIDGLWNVTEYDRETKTTRTRSINDRVWRFNMINRFGWTERREINQTNENPKRLIIQRLESKKSE